MEKVINSIQIVNSALDTISKLNDENMKRRSLARQVVEEFNNTQSQLIKESLSCAEMCKLLKISRPTLIRRRNAGKIPYLMLGKNFYYLDPEVYEGGIYG